MNNFIQQGHIKLIKSDSKDNCNFTKNAVLLNVFIKKS